MLAGGEAQPERRLGHGRALAQQRHRQLGAAAVDVLAGGLAYLAEEALIQLRRGEVRAAGYAGDAYAPALADAVLDVVQRADYLGAHGGAFAALGAAYQLAQQLKRAHAQPRAPAKRLRGAYVEYPVAQGLHLRAHMEGAGQRVKRGGQMKRVIAVQPQQALGRIDRVDYHVEQLPALFLAVAAAGVDLVGVGDEHHAALDAVIPAAHRVDLRALGVVAYLHGVGVYVLGYARQLAYEVDAHQLSQPAYAALVGPQQRALVREHLGLVGYLAAEIHVPRSFAKKRNHCILNAL